MKTAEEWWVEWCEGKPANETEFIEMIREEQRQACAEAHETCGDAVPRRYLVINGEKPGYPMYDDFYKEQKEHEKAAILNAGKE